MTENIKATLTGDAQIVPPALINIFNTSEAIEDPESVRRLLAEEPGISGQAERVIGQGIVASATRSLGTFIVGYDPKEEERIQSRRTLVAGVPLSPSDEKGAIIGEKMRQTLELLRSYGVDFVQGYHLGRPGELKM